MVSLLAPFARVITPCLLMMNPPMMPPSALPMTAGSRWPPWTLSSVPVSELQTRMVACVLATLALSTYSSSVAHPLSDLEIERDGEHHLGDG